MITDPTFAPFTASEIASTLRAVGEEFAQAEINGPVTEGLGRKYIQALTDYQNALCESPYSPTAMIIEPSEHDAMMQRRLNEELSRIQQERARILKHFRGVLSLNDEDDI